MSLPSQQLKLFVERVERLEDEKRETANQIRDVYADAKEQGFDVKTLRKVISLRRVQDHDRLEQEELLDLYKAALGMR